MRTLHEIAIEIHYDWKKPYFGKTWRGEVAKRVKAELKDMLKQR